MISVDPAADVIDQGVSPFLQSVIIFLHFAIAYGKFAAE